MRKILTLVIVLLSTCLVTIPATSISAASKTTPYGFVWQDDNTSDWNIQYYTYNYNDGGYMISDRVVLSGTKLYDKNGDEIVSNVETFSNEKKPTVIFKDSKLYFILSDGTIGKMTSSTSSNYSVTTVKYNNGYFTLDDNDIGESVRTTNSKSTSLNNLSFKSTKRRVDGGTISNSSSSNDNRSKNRVDMYSYDDDRIAYEAFKNGRSVHLVICKDHNVWSEKNQKLISDSCVGAKFVGFTREYTTVLYSNAGYLYYYLDNDTNYASPKKVRVGEILEFGKDSNGFITQITDSKRTQSIGKFIDE